MKKKLVLVVAIALIVVSACVLLVGCAPANPSDFMTKWAESKNKAVCTKTTEFGINGDITYTKYFEEDGSIEEISILEVEGENVNVYRAYNDEGSLKWNAYSEKTTDFFGDGFKDLLSEFNDNYISDGTEISKEIFEKNFTKKDGWYLGSGLLFDGCGIKITAKEMLIKYDMEDEIEFDQKYVIGGAKCEITKEAKAALAEWKAEQE